jgi:hypothetical protein
MMWILAISPYHFAFRGTAGNCRRAREKHTKERSTIMKRKVIAILTAALLVVGTVPAVFAAQGNPTGSQTVTGDGDVNYLDTKIFAVGLPTSASLDFVLDPQGLTEIEDGESAALADLQGGKIIPSAPAVIVNNSSVKTKVTVTLKGITAAGSGANTATATFVPWGTDDASTIASVNTGTNNNVLLYATPSRTNRTNDSDPFVPAGKGYILSTDEQVLNFILDPADYTVKNTSGNYTALADAGTGHGTGVLIGGYVNKNADWSHFKASTNPSTVSVHAVFSYAEDTTSSPTFVSGIPGLLEPATTFKALTLTPPVGFMNAEQVSFVDGGEVTISKGSNVNHAIEFNFGGKDATDVRNDGSPVSASALQTYFTFDKTGNEVIIKGAWPTSATKTITFKLAGDTDTTYTVILKFV